MDRPPPGPDPRQPGSPDPAERALAAALSAGAEARARGSAFGVALAHSRAGHALLGLGRPGEALTEFDETLGYVSLLRADGQHETLSLLHAVSPALPPPTADLGDLGLLEAWARVGRAAALAGLQRWHEADEAIRAAAPLVRGWRRRELRRALGSVQDRVARAGTDQDAALAALDRAVADARLDPTHRMQARLDRAGLLLERGQADEAARAALLIVRDADHDQSPQVVAAARQLLGAALLALGRDDEGVTSLSAAFEDYRALGDDAAVVAAAPGLASRLAGLGRAAEAEQVLAYGIAAARAAGQPAAESDLQATLGSIRDGLGAAAAAEAALAAFAAAVAAALRADDALRVADARHGEAVVRATRLAADHDQAVEALALLDQAKAAYESEGHPDRAAGCDHEAAALLGRLGSVSAAAARYRAAREAYLALPADRRDVGSWPDEVADCDANLALLAALATNEPPAVPDSAFRSGGHAMRHAQD